MGPSSVGRRTSENRLGRSAAPAAVALMLLFSARCGSGSLRPGASGGTPGGGAGESGRAGGAAGGAAGVAGGAHSGSGVGGMGGIAGTTQTGAAGCSWVECFGWCANDPLTIVCGGGCPSEAPFTRPTCGGTGGIAGGTGGEGGFAGGSGGAAVCRFGADQTCNDNPALSSLHGHCTDAGTCSCRNDAGANPTTGRCP